MPAGMMLAERRWGNGPRVIGLVHGLNSTSELWTDFAELVAARHRATVVAVDLRGHGASPRAESYGLDDFAADLVVSLPRRMDVVIGHSLGGRVLAAALPRLGARRAVFLDPAFALPVFAGPAGRALARAPGIPAATAWLFTRGTPGLTSENRARFRRSTETWDRRMTRPLLIELPQRPLPAFPLPEIPATIVPSDGSRLIRPRYADELRRAGWDLREFPGSVHDMATLDPIGTADVIEDLLR